MGVSSTPVNCTKRGPRISRACAARFLTCRQVRKQDRSAPLGGDDLKAAIKENDWNDLHIIARGNTLIHIINGRVMSVVIDDDAANRKMEGKIGIQLHVTKAAMKMEVRNIRLKTF